MPSLLEACVRTVAQAAQDVGRKALTRGLDAAFEDLETAGNEVVRTVAQAAQDVGRKALTRGLDAAFEDLETAGNEVVRRIQRGRARLKEMEKEPNSNG